MDIFLVNQGHPACMDLVKKLARGCKPGAIIPLTSDEMELYLSEDFQVLKLGSDESSDSSLSLTQVEPGNHYVIALKEGLVNIDDVLRISEQLDIKVSLVRER